MVTVGADSNNLALDLERLSQLVDIIDDLILTDFIEEQRV